MRTNIGLIKYCNIDGCKWYGYSGKELAKHMREAHS